MYKKGGSKEVTGKWGKGSSRIKTWVKGLRLGTGKGRGDMRGFGGGMKVGPIYQNRKTRNRS